jgi:superfamily II RNA helicase
LELPEYNDLVGLLEKGIGIHHSGMIPILREIVELMISKKYIKLLFATESFAIGLDCPIKTTVFSALRKFDGRGERQLHSHEYTQMAGRAGRRGIDTIGHVVHCNNLFDIPPLNDYKTMLSGKPQALVSKFRIHYSLILNLLKQNGQANIESFLEFAKKSMVNEELILEMRKQRAVLERLRLSIEAKQVGLENMRTPYVECYTYIQLEGQLKTLVNKKRKDAEREMSKIDDGNRTLKQDVLFVKELEKMSEEWQRESDHLAFLETFLRDRIGAICQILSERGFVSSSGKEEEETNLYMLTPFGKISANIAEIHPLIFAELYQDCGGFIEWSADQIIVLLSCFTDIKVAEEFRLDRPHCQDGFVQRHVETLKTRYQEYDDLEMERKMDTGVDYQNALNFDIMDFVLQWIACSCEEECKYFIQCVISERGISIGDYSKAMLKISVVAKELANVCEIVGNVELLHKLSQVDAKILKYVTTSQSLYV